jgi:hypothetical protein
VTDKLDEIAAHQRSLSPKFPTLAEAELRRMHRNVMFAIGVLIPANVILIIWLLVRVLS